MAGNQYGEALRREIAGGAPVAFAGVYDVFSASVAARSFPGVYLDMGGFAAGAYGLPDLGFNAWAEVNQLVQRIRLILPEHHLLVELDDRYADAEVVCRIVGQLETLGASGVVLVDEGRPARADAIAARPLSDADEFAGRLRAVLDARDTLFVAARTAAPNVDEAWRRAEVYAATGVDAALAREACDPDQIGALRQRVGATLALGCVARVGGGESAPSLTRLGELGVALVIYDDACLVAAYRGIADALRALRESDGTRPDAGGDWAACAGLLRDNLAGRNVRGPSDAIGR